MPAAGMVWPIIDLTEPITARGASCGGAPKKRCIVSNSASSPAGVAGAVRLDQPDRVGREIQPGPGFFQRDDLAFDRRRDQTAAAPIGRRADAFDHGVDAVARRDRVVEPLQYHHADAFAGQDAVGVGRQRTACAAPRQRAELAKRRPTKR
jgi:hypothetical protein